MPGHFGREDEIRFYRSWIVDSLKIGPDKLVDNMRRRLPLLLSCGLLIVGCYSSKVAVFQPVCSTGDTWQVKVVKSGVLPVIKVIVDDSTVISKSFPVLDWIGINTSGEYHGHSVELMVTYNSGFLGIGSYYDATITVDKKFFVGQFRLPTVNLGGD